MTDDSGLTPSQTVGPVPRDRPAARADRAARRATDSDPRAIRIRGRLLDGAGDPVPGRHGRDLAGECGGPLRAPGRTREDIPLEEGFLGFGRSGTVDDGWFEFVTVKPGRVPWVDVATLPMLGEVKAMMRRHAVCVPERIWRTSRPSADASPGTSRASRRR